MADNFTTPVPGGKTFAADEVDGKLHQRVKPTFGVDGEATDVSASNPLPVDLRSSALGSPLEVEMPGGTTVSITGVDVGDANDGPGPTTNVLYVQPVDESGDVITGGGGSGGEVGDASGSTFGSTQVMFVQPLNKSGEVIESGSSATLVTKRFNLAGVLSDGGSATLLTDPGDGFRHMIVGYAMGIYVTNVASPNEQWRVSLISGPETLAELHFVNNGGTITYAGSIDAPALVGLESWALSIRADRYQGSDGDINVIGHYTYYIDAV